MGSEYDTLLDLCTQYTEAHPGERPGLILIDTDSYCNLKAHCKGVGFAIKFGDDPKEYFNGIEIKVIDTNTTIIIVGDFYFKS